MTAHFPNNAKLPTKKLNDKSRKVSRRQYFEISNKNTVSLKEEFDLLMKYRYSNISAEDRLRIWHIIGKHIIENKIIIGTQIGSLEKLIKLHILSH